MEELVEEGYVKAIGKLVKKKVERNCSTKFKNQVFPTIILKKLVTY